MKVRLTLRALTDLERIGAYIRAGNPAGAERVRREIEAALRLLSTHPFAGRRYTGGRRRYALKRYPYLVFYQVDDQAGLVTVTTIRHGARRPETQ